MSIVTLRSTSGPRRQPSATTSPAPKHDHEVLANCRKLSKWVMKLSKISHVFGVWLLATEGEQIGSTCGPGIQGFVPTEREVADLHVVEHVGAYEGDFDFVTIVGIHPGYVFKTARVGLVDHC